MLDKTKLPHTFSVPFQGKPFDFVVTNASDDNQLVLNVASDTGSRRDQYGAALRIDRHAGNFDFSPELNESLYALRPVAMKINAIPAKVLSVVCRMTMRLLGSAPGTFALGTSEVAFAWNLVMLAIILGILFVALTMGMYVILPLLVLATLCFALDVLHFQKQYLADTKRFMETIANQVRDLVEKTVSY